MFVVGKSTVAAFILLCSEILFYIVFRFHLLPWANNKKFPQNYRGYGRDRHKLFVRIVKRLYRTFKYDDIRFGNSDFVNNQIDNCISIKKQHTLEKDEKDEKFASIVNAFFRNFFYDKYHTSRVTTRHDLYDSDKNEFLKKGDFDKLLAWAFFEKNVENLDSWELDEIDKMNQFLDESYGFSFKPGYSQNIVPCRLSIDPVLGTYKPLLVYLILIAINLMGMIILFACGFRLYTTSTNIRYWFRPTTKSDLSKMKNKFGNHSNLDNYPFLFFHGISPGGYTMYLPFLLYGILDNDRPIFLFETFSITCTLQFPLFQSSSENETIIAVKEAINNHIGANTKIILCGHSFGSCQITWLVHAIPNRIHKMMLVDPVTILLSNADVMVNFLYGHLYHFRHIQTLSTTTKFEIKSKRSRHIVSSELGIQYYLRKHFSWYNSELWLEDIPNNVEVIIFLSGQDDIINACDVKKEIQISIQTRKKAFEMSIDTDENKCKYPNLKLVYWPMDGHGDCILSPKRWAEIKQRIPVT